MRIILAEMANRYEQVCGLRGAEATVCCANASIQLGQMTLRFGMRDNKENFHSNGLLTRSKLEDLSEFLAGERGQVIEGWKVSILRHGLRKQRGAVWLSTLLP